MTMRPRKVVGSKSIKQYDVTGDCLQGLGIPDGAIMYTDCNIEPVVGDLVHVAKIAGAMSSYIKQVLSIDSEGDIKVGTKYLDSARDYDFVAGELFGTVIKVTDREGNIVYERKA